METIKGLLSLLLVAVVVFTAVQIFNHTVASSSATTLKHNALAGTSQTVKHTASGKISGANVLQKNQRPSL